MTMVIVLSIGLVVLVFAMFEIIAEYIYDAGYQRGCREEHERMMEYCANCTKRDD